jgi:PAS domain S-box-containing protein
MSPLRQARVERTEAVSLDSRTVHRDIGVTDSADATDRIERAEARARRALKEKDDAVALLDSVLAGAPVGVALHDNAFRIVRMNAAMVDFYGLPSPSSVGRALREVVPQHAVALEALFARVIATGTAERSVEIVSPAAESSGSPRHWVASAFPVHGAGGIPDGVGLVILDATERKALEGQLLQAQKMEAVGRLAGGIAHDFNNVLTAVMSYSDLLLQDLAPSDRRRDDVVEIASAARRAAALTRQLLAFSRQQVLQAWPLDLNATVTEIEKMLGRLIGADVEVVTLLEPRLGIVKADRGQIEQVIVNLAVNARDAMADGGVLIIQTANVVVTEQDARADPTAVPGDYVRLSVSDTGTGMTAQVRARIFEPFFTTKERGKGTGLGLSTVYGIVKQSGGSIAVTSEPGRGTTFDIYLPRVDATPVISAPGERRGSGHHGSEVILLVDDDPAVRTVAGRILRAAGYAVLEACNGAHAMEICENPDLVVDLIITDVVMPDMGGREFARLLRQLRPRARMLFMSGYTGPGPSGGPVAAPGYAFMEKPFTMDALARKVRDVLDAPISDPA